MKKVDEIKSGLTKQLSAHEELNMSFCLTEMQHQNYYAC